MPRAARVLLAWGAGVVAVLLPAVAALAVAGLPAWADVALAALALVVALMCGGALALRLAPAPAAPVAAAAGGCGACGQSCALAGSGTAGSGSVDSRACSSAS